MRRHLLALSLVLAAPALAFGPRPHGHGPPDPVEASTKLAEHLGLDDATRETVESILAESVAKGQKHAERVKELVAQVQEERAKASPNRKVVAKLVHQVADERAELFLLRMDTGDEIAALLTPEQAERFRRFRERQLSLGEEPARPPEAFFDL